MQEEINKKLIEEVCKNLEYYDQNGKLPGKIRIDITVSQEALVKLEGKNRSKVINDLILS